MKFIRVNQDLIKEMDSLNIERRLTTTAFREDIIKLGIEYMKKQLEKKNA